jgi:predicted nuclease of predicted toxin-antitoxin system
LTFLIDMPVTRRAVSPVKDKGNEAVHASAVRLSGRPDIEVPETARAEGRVIVTANRRRASVRRRSRKSLTLVEAVSSSLSLLSWPPLCAVADRNG